jgi:hypothetical protein
MLHIPATAPFGAAIRSTAQAAALYLCIMHTRAPGALADADAAAASWLSAGPQFANKLDELLERVDSQGSQVCATEHIEVSLTA